MSRSRTSAGRRRASQVSADNAERMCRIIAARAAVDASNAELRAAVHAAREAGDSCAMIAAALDTTRVTSSLDDNPPTTS